MRFFTLVGVYVNIGSRRFRFNGALDFLGDRPDDEVKGLSFGFLNPLCIYIVVILYFCVFSTGGQHLG